MPLTNCYECGMTVSTAAAFCPSCGAPQPAQSRPTALPSQPAPLVSTIHVPVPAARHQNQTSGCGRGCLIAFCLVAALVILLVALMIIVVLISPPPTTQLPSSQPSARETREHDQPAAIPQRARAREAPERSVMDTMALAFEGQPSKASIKAKMDEAFSVWNVPKTDDNYSRYGSVLVSLRKESGRFTEMELLHYVIHFHNEDTGKFLDLKTALAYSATLLDAERKDE